MCAASSSLADTSHTTTVTSQQRRSGRTGAKQNDWQKSVVCKYFYHGMCSRGGGEQGCSYSHDMSLSNRGTIPCKYYKQGTCAYGDACRFSHGEVGRRPLPLNPNAKEFKSSTAADDLAARFSSQLSFVDTTWAEAPEFVPRSFQQQLESSLPSATAAAADDAANKTWAQIVDKSEGVKMSVEEAESQLCPFGMVGECRYGEHCAYVHGDVCEMCATAALHPSHEKQRDHHEKLCMKQHEKQMELAFAIKRSKSKTCGICMEVVMEKKPVFEARFGIMPNCNHCYCLSCLRKWRQAKQFEHTIVRACPECRQTSDYICPSKFWIDTKEEKDELLSNYKKELQKKKCKYFKEGDGTCPFGNRCFYRHEGRDGRPVDVGPPETQQRRVSRASGSELSGDDRALIQSILLHDFLEMRQELSDAVGGGGAFRVEDMLDILDLLSDGDDSDLDDF